MLFQGQGVSNKLTYAAMVVEAVAALSQLTDKDYKFGSSLVAIRKHILTTYGANLKKQTASFNSLTLKGINKVSSCSIYILTISKWYLTISGYWKRWDWKKPKEKRALSSFIRWARATGLAWWGPRTAGTVLHHNLIGMFLFIAKTEELKIWRYKRLR